MMTGDFLPGQEAAFGKDKGTIADGHGYIRGGRGTTNPVKHCGGRSIEFHGGDDNDFGGWGVREGKVTYHFHPASHLDRLLGFCDRVKRKEWLSGVGEGACEDLPGSAEVQNFGIGAENHGDGNVPLRRNGERLGGRWGRRLSGQAGVRIWGH